MDIFLKELFLLAVNELESHFTLVELTTKGLWVLEKFIQDMDAFMFHSEVARTQFYIMKSWLHNKRVSD